jgi:hypothetical protein
LNAHTRLSWRNNGTSANTSLPGIPILRKLSVIRFRLKRRAETAKALGDLQTIFCIEIRLTKQYWKSFLGIADDYGGTISAKINISIFQKFCHSPIPISQTPVESKARKRTKDTLL